MIFFRTNAFLQDIAAKYIRHMLSRDMGAATTGSSRIDAASA